MSKESPKGHQEGDAKRKITFGNAKSFLKSAWSKGLSGKRVDERTKSLRVISCHGDESRQISPCEWRRLSEEAEGTYYCGRCGCGDSPKTWLNSEEDDAYTKLDYPNVVCPLQMPGFTNYKPYGQEDSDLAKEHVSARKMNIEFTLYSEGVDLAHRGVDDTPEELIGVEEPPQPEVQPEEEKKPCKKCGRKPEEKKPCSTCGRKGKESNRPEYPPRPTPTERVKNSIDDINLG